MLESEINIMKKLNHPNIVKIFDVLLTINNAYVIIEYCN
jgi:serine/threonine protein kinase